MIDVVTVSAAGGNGGNGVAAFHREKHTPRGGPSGGNGGSGGAVIVITDSAMDSLEHLQRSSRLRGTDGQPGGVANRHGKDGVDTEVRVPVGTCLFSVAAADGDSADHLIADLAEDGQRFVVTAGGRGGLGNTRFVSAVNREPRLAEAGERGTTRTVRFELKPPVDVAFVGLPNVGKSSLLAALTDARPRVAAYPFSTTEPVRGVMRSGHRALTAVDIPSLVENAHGGKGLGSAFLRHAERAAIIVHVLDGTRDSLAEDLEIVSREIGLFSDEFAHRYRVIVVNKLDLPDVAAARSRFEEELRTAVGNETPVLFVSATEAHGTSALLETLFEMSEADERDDAGGKRAAPSAPEEALQPEPQPPERTPRATAVRSGDAYRITHPRAVRIARGSDLDDFTVQLQYHGELARLGVIRRLEELGIQSGDTVKAGDLEFQWE
ncbi:MAG: Obg family GTPase CgtA [Chloroflexi bacterium]|nr:Obg family GTPase CgtA [Chloroflexota bacterium]